MLLLSLYLAIYPRHRGGHHLEAGCVRRRCAHSSWRRLAWVATEYARGVLLSGFPWVPLGNSQVTVLPVAQMASVLRRLWRVGARRVHQRDAGVCAAHVRADTRSSLLVAAAIVLFAVGAWGTWRVADGSLTREGTPIRVGLVQGNIAQEDKWNPREARRIFTTYIAMTRDVVRRGAEYVIWPESSTPFTFEDRTTIRQAMRRCATWRARFACRSCLGSDQVIRASR